MAWYYIDGAGTTLGPVEESVLASKWKSQEITRDTYVWNGTTVNQWSLIKDCAALLKKIDKKPAAPSGGTRAAAPKRPKMGGGRGNLLDSIRAGKKLKKAAPKPAASSSGGSSGGSAKPKGKLSLQEQLAMRLKKGGGNKGGSTANKSVRQPAKKANPKPKPAATANKQPTRSSGGAKVNKTQLKKKIDQCNDDWILKAVQKLLD